MANYVFTETVAVCIGQAWFWTTQSPRAWRKGRIHIHPQCRIYFQLADSFKWIIRFLQRSLSRYITTLMAGHMSRSRWPTQNKLNGIFVDCVILLCLGIFFLSCWSFACIFQIPFFVGCVCVRICVCVCVYMCMCVCSFQCESHVWVIVWHLSSWIWLIWSPLHIFLHMI